MVEEARRKTEALELGFYLETEVSTKRWEAREQRLVDQVEALRRDLSTHKEQLAADLCSCECIVAVLREDTHANREISTPILYVSTTATAFSLSIISADSGDAYNNSTSSTVFTIPASANRITCAGIFNRASYIKLQMNHLRTAPEMAKTCINSVHCCLTTPFVSRRTNLVIHWGSRDCTPTLSIIWRAEPSVSCNQDATAIDMVSDTAIY